jgi:glycosyltransferase involved in cell wall biosynthesis
MHILIVAPFCSLPGEQGYNRFLHLAELLAQDHKVSLVTSRFRHYDKTFRPNIDAHKLRFSLYLLSEPGYFSNISLSRLYSHKVFCSNFQSFFFTYCETNGTPDVAYAAYPLAKTSIFLGTIKSAYNFKLIVDVQDVWPESIKPAFPLLSFIPDHFFPFSWTANSAYRSADALVAVSNTYLKRALHANPFVKSHVTYIGASRDLINSVDPMNYAHDTINVVYIGAIASSYDLQTVIKAFVLLDRQDPRYQLHIFGDGPKLRLFKKIASKNVVFYGFRPYAEAIAYAKSASILLNPISSSAKQTITNKISDYLLLSRPIVSSQLGVEVNKLLDLADVYRYRGGCIRSFLHALSEAYSSMAKEKKCSQRVIDLLDRATSYRQLVDFIQSS